MKYFKFKIQAVAVAILASMFTIGSTVAEDDSYEIWGSDQSNSVANVDSRGVSGSWLWVWESEDVEVQLKGGEVAKPLGCNGNNIAGEGPCNLYDVFPSTLVENDSNGPTGQNLRELPGFGRLHGMLPDPQNLYMNVNIFAPDGGYIGIIDGETKEAVALFRVTGTNIGRSVHMSFWSSDGSALLVANLNGKVLERIDIKRNETGKIISATFNKSASLGVGKEMAITDEAKVYLGTNSQGNSMLGSISGSYEEADFGNLTPNEICKENGCSEGSNDRLTDRSNNVIICPITSNNDNVYITLGSGGLLVANLKTTPMQIVAEYDSKTVNGAGCGGVQVGNEMWLNAGVSASEAGATQSTFTMYSIDDSQLGTNSYTPNTPEPKIIFKDPTNTTTIGNGDGNSNEDTTGQLPVTTARRDAHGMARTLSGSHIHNVDRIQNNVEAIDTQTLARTTYDLTSADGQGNGVGPCTQASVTDDPNLPKNDPAPDLLENTPDGKYLVVALRGPIPVSVAHSAQGSCPGVGIIELLDGGASGRLVGVLRTTNLVDNSPMSAPGGHRYTGSEHSDIHGASVRKK